MCTKDTGGSRDTHEADTRTSQTNLKMYAGSVSSVSNENFACVL